MTYFDKGTWDRLVSIAKNKRMASDPSKSLVWDCSACRTGYHENCKDSECACCGGMPTNKS